MSLKAFSFLFMGLAIISIISCEKETPEEESVRISKHIAEASYLIIEEAIDLAVKENGAIDPNGIARSIESINGVVIAAPNSSGTAINVVQDDGFGSSILIVKQNDERLIKVTDMKSSVDLTDNKGNPNGAFSIPTGNKKVLILAPFQDEIKTNLNKISELFKAYGFVVDQFINFDVTLEKIRGSFLNDYDIVLIITHGEASGSTGLTIESTLLSTREVVNVEGLGTRFSTEEYNSLGRMGIDGKLYFALSVPWLNLTTYENFNSTWIYASACESAKPYAGSSSLTEAFLMKGAGGFSGFYTPISNLISNPIAEEMIAQFLSGLNMYEATIRVHNNPFLLYVKWTISIGGLIKTYNVSSFNSFQSIQKPFFIIMPGIKDRDGNIYDTVSIGSQVWFAENLRTTTLSDGTSISQITGTSNWSNLAQPGYCWFNNKPEMYGNTHGALYNWKAVATGRLCPDGWHVPTDYEWNILATNIGGDTYGGDVLKNEIGWRLPGGWGFVPDQYGFSAVPAGYRSTDGAFIAEGHCTFWWSSTQSDGDNSLSRALYQDRANLYRYSEDQKNGYSVRCIQDSHDY
ncbi:MAG TPA: FISUMP domain-containing protein [Candidatus Cloacimonadota bacterium]|nr:FISUMP domain-containing protein [Candidatus Cloacimonadota bacterium]